MSGPWVETRILARRDWSDDLITLTAEAPLSPFEPGQFVSLGVADPGGERIERPYSLASPPGRAPELLFNEVKEGELTPRLFRLRAGDPVWITTKPGGQFTLRYVKDAPVLWMLATGTGLAPFMSMLRDGEVWRRFGRVVLVHAVRFERHLAYREELDRLSDQLISIRIVSREPPPPGMLGGRIGARLDDGTLEKIAGARIEKGSAQVMLCGHPDMTKSVRAQLEARGLTRNRMRSPGEITTEPYW